jgi:hypothetical protein
MSRSGWPERDLGRGGLARARLGVKSGGRTHALAPARTGLAKEQSMSSRELSRIWGPRSRHRKVDDAYTAWFGAHSRCTQALRAWNAAAGAARAAAYRAYLIELTLEEAAAAELERLHAPPLAS